MLEAVKFCATAVMFVGIAWAVAWAIVRTTESENRNDEARMRQLFPHECDCERTRSAAAARTPNDEVST